MKSSQFSKALKRNSWGGREKKKKKSLKSPNSTNPNQVSRPEGQYHGFWGRCSSGRTAPRGPAPSLAVADSAPRAGLGLRPGLCCSGTQTRVGRKAARPPAAPPRAGVPPRHNPEPGSGSPRWAAGPPHFAPAGPSSTGRGQAGSDTTTGKSCQGTTRERPGLGSMPRPGDRSPRRPAGPGRPLPGLPLLAPLTRQLRRRRTPPAAGPGSGPALPRGSW